MKLPSNRGDRDPTGHLLPPTMFSVPGLGYIQWTCQPKESHRNPQTTHAVTPNKMDGKVPLLKTTPIQLSEHGGIERSTQCLHPYVLVSLIQDLHEYQRRPWNTHPKWDSSIKSLNYTLEKPTESQRVWSAGHMYHVTRTVELVQPGMLKPQESP